MKPTVLVLLLLSPFAAAAAESAPATTGLSPDAIRDSVLSAMDPRADPCQDFYRYACGGWLDTTRLPADEARWARSFSTISERNREIVRALLEDAAANPGEPGTERQKIGDFYGACMDEAAIERAGTTPLEPLLAIAGSARDAATLLRAAGELGRADIDVLLG